LAVWAKENRGALNAPAHVYQVSFIWQALMSSGSAYSQNAWSQPE
jgi:hypothetical protein